MRASKDKKSQSSWKPRGRQPGCLERKQEWCCKLQAHSGGTWRLTSTFTSCLPRNQKTHPWQHCQGHWHTVLPLPDRCKNDPPSWADLAVCRKLEHVPEQPPFSLLTAQREHAAEETMDRRTCLENSRNQACTIARLPTSAGYLSQGIRVYLWEGNPDAYALATGNPVCGRRCRACCREVDRSLSRGFHGQRALDTQPRTA